MDVTDANFDEKVIQASSKKPVLVDFWASWCGPCRILGPTLEKVAKADNRFTLAKISVEENQKMPSKYNVMSIPSVKLFKDGNVTAEFIGAKPESELKIWLDENL